MTPPRKTALTEEHLRLILEHARSVPHLEALLLLWETAPRAWPVADIAARIYVPTDAAGRILRELVHQGLVAEATADHYALTVDAGGRELAGTIALAYRDNVSRVATLIHAGPSKALQDFARAFRIKERED